MKIDLLGNRSLAVIRDALAELRGNGCGVDESGWEPEDDSATQETVAQGRTMGCFYIESPAMRLLQQKSRRGDFEHLVIHSSIIRPAANKYIREYVRRLHGGAWTPIHPLLSDVLERDLRHHGLPGGRLARGHGPGRVRRTPRPTACARCSPRRTARGSCRTTHDASRPAPAAAGSPRSRSPPVWDMMMSFDGYSFCKPHSASYARVSFQAAYLKTHYPAEFMAAVISNQGGFYSAFAYVSEARRLGLTVLPPDVSASRVRWSGCDGRLRVGLLSIKGLAAETQRRIVDGQPYAGLRDFLDRVRPDEGEARALVHAGALDRLEPGAARAALLWEIARWGRTRTAPAGGRARSLFGEDSRGDAPPPRLPPDDPHERLRREFAVLGFLCDRHPMVLYADAVRRTGAVRAVELPRHVGRRVRFAGWLISGKLVSTKTGEPMEFLTFEDETGLVETTFFPQAYRRFCHLLDPERPFVLSGTVEQDWGRRHPDGRPGRAPLR